MRHPTEGVLRRLIDEPAGVAEDDRTHVADCPACLRELARVQEEARRVGSALATGRLDLDVSSAWERLSATLPAAPGVTGRRSLGVRVVDGSPGRPGLAGRTAPNITRRARSRPRDLLRRPAAAVLAVGLVLTGASAAAANDWLQVFRTQQVQAVGLTSADLVALPDLSAYGDLTVTGEPGVHGVPSAAVAAAETGLDVPEVADLPRGVAGDPTLQVGGRLSAVFTFSADRAARAAAVAGEALPPLPPGVDGSRVRLEAGPGVAQVWTSDAGVPALLVGRAVAPTAYSSGVPFGVVRDYVLSLPGLPDDVADQLRTFAADGSTLPLPVPADLVTTSTVEVDGAPATLLETRDRALAAVLWVDDGVVTVVAGSLDTDEVLEVARELR